MLREICKLVGAVIGEHEFSTADHIQAIKGDRRYGRKYWYVANDNAKLQGISINQFAFKKRLFLCTKHTGTWLIVWGTMVTITVIAATEFRDFYVLVITLTLLSYKINVMVTCRSFWCITQSDEEM